LIAVCASVCVCVCSSVMQKEDAVSANEVVGEVQKLLLHPFVMHAIHTQTLEHLVVIKPSSETLVRLILQLV